MLRDVTLTIKLIGGPLGAEYKEIVVFFKHAQQLTNLICGKKI